MSQLQKAYSGLSACTLTVEAKISIGYIMALGSLKSYSRKERLSTITRSLRTTIHRLPIVMTKAYLACCLFCASGWRSDFVHYVQVGEML